MTGSDIIIVASPEDYDLRYSIEWVGGSTSTIDLSDAYMIFTRIQ